MVFFVGNMLEAQVRMDNNFWRIFSQVLLIYLFSSSHPEHLKLVTMIFQFGQNWKLVAFHHPKNFLVLLTVMQRCFQRIYQISMNKFWTKKPENNNRNNQNRY